MAKRHILSVISFVIAAFFLFPSAICAQTLVAYCYDSFAADWGPGPAIAEAFKRETGIELKLVSRGDGGQLLSQLIIEKSAPKADIAIGIDQNQLAEAIRQGIFEPYAPKLRGAIPEALVMDPEWRVTPFDYGYFAIMWDSAKLRVPPKSLADLAKPEFRKSLVIMDPRTSTPGLGFLSWLVGLHGASWEGAWKAIKGSVLTVTPGWDAGYAMFASGDEPLALSYTTSPAYHVEYEGTDRFKALSFPEGHPLQIEGAGIVKGTRNRALAERFIDFMLSEGFQTALPLTQFMYPVIPSTPLPASFAACPAVKAAPKPDPAILRDALARWAELK
jgi:thiamine transport system substrate-binding protein